MFSRAFSSQVQPVEIARKLAKEMDAHRTASVSRVYVPNQYTVWLSAEDHERLEGYERSLGAGAVRLPARARAPPRLRAADPPGGRARDRRAAAARGVRDPDPAGEAARPPGRGRRRRGSRATRWSTRFRRSSRASERRRPGGRLIETKAIVSLDDRRYVLDGPVAVLGRSRECDCVLSDPNVSREHAELRRGSTGDWQIVDLGSTNGIKVNDRRVDRSRLSPGDEVTLGTTRFTFDIEQ